MHEKKSLPVQFARKVVLGACVLLIGNFSQTTGEASGKGPERDTAEWVQANIHELNGKTVGLNVRHVSVGRVEGPSTWVEFYTGTRDGDYCGGLGAWVPNERVKILVRDFGTETRWTPSGKVSLRRITATVRLDDEGYPYLELPK